MFTSLFISSIILSSFMFFFLSFNNISINILIFALHWFQVMYKMMISLFYLLDSHMFETTGKKTACTILSWLSFFSLLSHNIEWPTYDCIINKWMWLWLVAPIAALFIVTHYKFLLLYDNEFLLLLAMCIDHKISIRYAIALHSTATRNFHSISYFYHFISVYMLI